MFDHYILREDLLGSTIKASQHAGVADNLKGCRVRINSDRKRKLRDESLLGRFS